MEMVSPAQPAVEADWVEQGEAAGWGETSMSPMALSFLTSEARKGWVGAQLQSSEAEYTEGRPLTVRICTWNVNALGAPPPRAQISAWILGGGESSDGSGHLPQGAEGAGAVVDAVPWMATPHALPAEASQGAARAQELPDLIAVGLQETVKLTAAALSVNTASNESRRWHVALTEALEADDPDDAGYATGAGGSTQGRAGRYVVLVSRQYVGVYQLVVARAELVDRGVVGDARCKAVGCGLLGQLGNKGAVSAMVTAHGCRLALLCCHLAAGDSAALRRDADVATILSRTVFEDSAERRRRCMPAAPEALPQPQPQVPARPGPVPARQGEGPPATTLDGASSLTVDSAHVCFLYGDLNYRIDLPREAVVRSLASGQLAPLHAQDQLQRRLGVGGEGVLAGFQETPPCFWPTYKYDPGTDRWDTSEKRRTPAWCDRVLWRCRGVAGQGSRARCEQCFYRRHEVCDSDHRPVSAAFQLELPAVEPVRLAATLARLERELDQADNDCAPVAVLDRLGAPGQVDGSQDQAGLLDFGHVRYRERRVLHLLLRNRGPVTLFFRLLPRGPPQAQLGSDDDGRARRCMKEAGGQWVRVEPAHGLIEPGESVSLRVILRVSAAASRAVIAAAASTGPGLAVGWAVGMAAGELQDSLVRCLLSRMTGGSSMSDFCRHDCGPPNVLERSWGCGFRVVNGVWVAWGRCAYSCRRAYGLSAS